MLTKKKLYRQCEELARAYLDELEFSGKLLDEQIKLHTEYANLEQKMWDTEDELRTAKLKLQYLELAYKADTGNEIDYPNYEEVP